MPSATNQIKKEQSMSKYYENGFYETQNPEQTRIKITDKKWRELLHAQSIGNTIVSDTKNNPQISTTKPRDNYAVKRQQEYPKIEEFLDAYVKINSTDSAIKSAGTRQMQQYVQKCQNIKKKYPKE